MLSREAPKEAPPIKPGFVWMYPGQVVRVIDGDTVECRVQFSPMETHDVHGLAVRVEGINALEQSAKFGSEATAFARTLLPAGMKVMIVSRKREKYGRFLARLTLPDGSDYSEHMLTAKASDGTTPLAVPFMA